MMEPFNSSKHDQFMHLYMENEQALRGFIRSLVPTLEDSKEVMQETAAVLWRKFESLDSPDDFRRWAFGVARFEALASRRDHARDRHVFGDELLQLLADEAERVVSDEEAALQGCLKKLPDKQVSLLEAAYTQDKRIDEMALAAGRTPMALYKSLHRIRMSLASCIKKQLNQDQQAT